MLCDALSALYLLFLPPLLSGRPRDRCRPCDRLRRRWHFFLFSRASRQAPPLIIPISPIPFSHAYIRFCYCYCLLLFWCIACFCNLLIVTVPAYPKLLSIGWLVIHQWPPPCPCCHCFIIEDPIPLIASSMMKQGQQGQGGGHWWIINQPILSSLG